MSKIVVENLQILKNKYLGSGTYSIKIAPFSKIKSVRPGQFIHLLIPNCHTYFRRAFSIFDLEIRDKSLEILFKVFGRGTLAMSQMKKGDVIDVLGPLGNGFQIPKRKEKIICIAGGVGLPPIYFLAKYLIDKGYNSKNIFFYYGGRTGSDIVESTRIKKIGVSLIIATEDGAVGEKGLVTDLVERNLPEMDGTKVIYSCGPEGMLKAVDILGAKYNIPGQLSLEAPMPCGIGVCLGCILPLKEGGYTRVCRDGPVYDMGEVIL